MRIGLIVHARQLDVSVVHAGLIETDYAEGVGYFQPKVASTLGQIAIVLSTLKGLAAHRPNAFSVCLGLTISLPRVVADSNLGLELANASGVLI